MADNLIQLRGVKGGTVYYDPDGLNGFRNVSYRVNKGGRVKKLVCYTEKMLRYIHESKEDSSEIKSCLCTPGHKHNHPPLTLDAIRLMYIRHGIRLRCILFGGRSCCSSFARMLCAKYFEGRYDEFIDEVMAILATSGSSLREGYAKGILMARGDGAYGDGCVSTQTDSRLQVRFNNGLDEEFEAYCSVYEWDSWWPILNLLGIKPPYGDQRVMYANVLSRYRNVSIKKVGVELKPIPFDELPPNVQEWLESEEYEEMGTSLPSYEDMYPSRKRKYFKKGARD